MKITYLKDKSENKWCIKIYLNNFNNKTIESIQKRIPNVVHEIKEANDVDKLLIKFFKKNNISLKEIL